jgi:hypothetical protein
MVFGLYKSPGSRSTVDLGAGGESGQLGGMGPSDGPDVLFVALTRN